MADFFSKSDKSLVQKFLAGALSKEELAFQLLPLLTLEIISKYLRIDVEGIENIPRNGSSIIISNHSGYSGFDAIMLSNEIRKHLGKPAKILAHKLWFVGKPVRVLSEKMGLIKAELQEAIEILKESSERLILFPEGEAGNFKSSARRYRLQPFKGGFIRSSMITGAPIVPACVIGAEETHINLSQIKFTKQLIGTVIPVPLNIIPIPIQWKIKFFPPIHLNEKAESAGDRELVYKHSRKIRRQLQRRIVQELRKRRSIDTGEISLNSDDEPGF